MLFQKLNVFCWEQILHKSTSVFFMAHVPTRLTVFLKATDNTEVLFDVILPTPPFHTTHTLV